MGRGGVRGSLWLLRAGCSQETWEESAIPKFQLDDIIHGSKKKKNVCLFSQVAFVYLTKSALFFAKDPVSYKYFFIIELIASLKM